MKKTYTLGECDYNGNGRKINLCEFEFELRECGKGLCFTMAAAVWNGRHTDHIMGGQCCDRVLEYFPEDKQAARMVEIWSKYHLNDMHPECEHQRELGWRETAATSVDYSEYWLADAYMKRQTAIKDSALARLVKIGSVTLDPDAQLVLSLPFSTRNPGKYSPDMYKLHKAETKTLGWLKETEHESGLLCKPCPVCGYEYGSAWKYMPIPADIIEEIKSW